MSEIIHKTRIVSIGASALDDNTVIFFQDNVPAYLAEYCYLIEPGEGGYDIRVGHELVLGDVRCPITAIGDVALENFRQLGHLTVHFDGAPEAVRPGSIHVRSNGIPPMAAGTEVKFVCVD